jgi:hypothetical protein
MALKTRAKNNIFYRRIFINFFPICTLQTAGFPKAAVCVFYAAFKKLTQAFALKKQTFAYPKSRCSKLFRYVLCNKKPDIYLIFIIHKKIYEKEIYQTDSN